MSMVCFQVALQSESLHVLNSTCATKKKRKKEKKRCAAVTRIRGPSAPARQTAANGRHVTARIRPNVLCFNLQKGEIGAGLLVKSLKLRFPLSYDTTNGPCTKFRVGP